ncbi:GNAT family N-acetyltransferase [Saccharothrix obliqua]|uniref:GNAT family N-acetyltransferase n=1 Tax=Saccharothrix obliqua TaxID=2861747 RepID=UPI001C5DAC97|nr:GNAT family N-acetyltransferase [Saccharothrix obliqua]MBW4721888.1 GNAT family N-acetyltransferase [Saccharothrix obliqua]
MDPVTTTRISIRRATRADAEAVTAVFLASRAAAMPYLPRLHSDAATAAWIRDVVLAHSTVWVAVDGAEVVGFSALDGSELDHLYLHPDACRRGIGSRLLRIAVDAAPNALRLRVFQRNTAARAFYEHHGFVAVDHDDGTRNEENEPDMTYQLGKR